jgi:hypothetical protein
MYQKFLQGKFLEQGDMFSPFMKAQVISFDQTGGLLENPNGAGVCRSRVPESRDYYDMKARVGPKNPPGSLRARIITGHADMCSDDSDLKIFYPLYQHSTAPVPLEFVYVFFETRERHRGVWVSKVEGPFGEKTNFAPGDTSMRNSQNDNNSMPLAAAHGNAPQQPADFSGQSSIGGSRTDYVSLKGLEFKP